MKSLTRTTAAAITIALALGCTPSAPPRELLDARTAYERARQSPNSTLVKSDLFEARQALGHAERQFQSDGDAQSTRDLAYIAERKARTASAAGEMARAVQTKELALVELDHARRQQAAEEDLERSKRTLSQAQDQVESERRARIAADERTREALSSVEGLKAGRSERGLVLTLSSEVLFASGKTVLLPSAQTRLDKVAQALKDDTRRIIVVGHTDSRGSDAANERLSLRRSMAVKNYLVRQGVPDGRMRAEGMGESLPISSNESEEGRAENRRVEIILENGGASEPSR
jgi:outer membrane protein OmpA-like peptidoglycan-associated protein